MVAQERSLRLLKTLVGLVAVEDGNIVSFKPYGQDPESAAGTLLNIEEGSMVEELRQILEEVVSKGYRLIITNDDNLANLISSSKKLSVEISKDTFPTNVEELFVNSRLFDNLKSYREYVNKISSALVALKLKKEVGKRDVMIVHASNLLEDLNKQINLVYTRCKEWYSLHFPEMGDVIDRPEDYLKIVASIGLRSEFSSEKLKEVLGDSENSKKLLELAPKSVGIAIEGQDMDQIRSLAMEGLRLIERREEVEDYIKGLMFSEAPNISSITGPILGAKLISLAGSLEKLARMPSSTIQVLGAEKALFRYFRTGKGAPKHGVIFQHPYVHGSPKWQRGKIARVLAAKIAIAAKLDFLASEDRSAELRKSLEERVKEIKAKYQSPRKVKEPRRKLKKKRR